MDVFGPLSRFGKKHEDIGESLSTCQSRAEELEGPRSDCLRFNMARITIVIENDRVVDSCEFNYNEGDGEMKTMVLTEYTKMTIEASDVEKIDLGKIKDMVITTE